MVDTPPRRWITILVMVLLTLSTAAMLLPSTWGEEAPAFEWEEDHVLSESTEASDDATVALMPDGGMVVAWRERQVARYNIFFVVLDGDGDVVGSRKELGSNLSASMDPVVAVDGDARIHFIWTAMEDQELWYARADARGDIVKGPVRLTEAQGDSAEASVWIDNRDHIHIVWFDGRDTVTYLYYMQLDRSGNKVVEDTQLVRTRTEQESAVAMDSRGDLHVVWNSLAPLGQIQWNTAVHYTKVSSSGDVLVDDRVIATSRGNIGFPDIAVDLSNNVHVVFPDGIGPRETVRYAKLDSSGRTITDTEVVGGTDSMGAGDVTVAVDGNNRLHLVWSQGLTGTTELHYQTLDDEGDPLDDPLQLTDDVGDSRFPAIGLSAKGEPRVAWSDWRSGNAEVYLKVAKLPVQGVDLAVYARDIIFDPPTVTGGEPFNVTVAVLNQGDSRVDQAQIEIAVDGAQAFMGTIYNLAPGAVSENSFELTVAEGDHVIGVTVTPVGVSDLALHNNEARRSVTAYPPGLLLANAGPDIDTVAGVVTYLDASLTVYRGTGVLSYEWNFGDGSATAFGEYVDHVYDVQGTYTVSLRVSDGIVEDTDGCRVNVLERNDPPHATIVPDGPVVGDRMGPVSLSATGSVDDKGIVSLTWEMGDGTVLDGWSVSHQYTDIGIYPVTLTVEDAGGLIDINRTTVSIENLAPEVTDVNGPKKVDVGVKAAFSVTATDAEGAIKEIGWDFDAEDGITFEAMGASIEHTFGIAGKYNVTCIVRDADGGQTVVHLEVKVVDDGSSGIPAFPIALAVAAMLIASALYLVLDKKPYQSE